VAAFFDHPFPDRIQQIRDDPGVAMITFLFCLLALAMLSAWQERTTVSYALFAVTLVLSIY